MGFKEKDEKVREKRLFFCVRSWYLVYYLDKNLPDERFFVAKLIFENSGEEVIIADGADIIEACEEQGVPFACTEGVCGTCVIEVTEGMENTSPFTQEEKDFLGEQDKERLACQCKILGGCVRINF